MILPGQTLAVEFTTRNPATGAATDADDIPLGTLVRNGVDDAATVTVTSKGATGQYKASVVVPSGWTLGDQVQLRITATLDGITDNMDIVNGNIDIGVDRLVKLAEADLYVDTGVVPWAIVWIQKGTGGIGVGTELQRKRVKDVDGTNIISTDVTIGQTLQ